MSGFCPGSGKNIGRVPVWPGRIIVCEVCGQECGVSIPSPKKQRAGIQATYAFHREKQRGEVALKVKSEDVAVKSQREALAQRVINYFGACLPESRLLCFLDDEDPYDLNPELGPANLGEYRPLHVKSAFDGLPPDVKEFICPLDFTGRPTERRFDDLVYLKGSACVDEVGLTMTLAHELQHSIQHAKMRKLWATNSLASQFLIFGLDKSAIETLKLTWADIPIEREARIVSKRVAECLFGEERVSQYIEKKIAQRVTEEDVADWQFIRTLPSSSSVDLAGATKQLFERLTGYKATLEEWLRKTKENDPDFSGIDALEPTA